MRIEKSVRGSLFGITRLRRGLLDSKTSLSGEGARDKQTHTCLREMNTHYTRICILNDMRTDAFKARVTCSFWLKKFIHRQCSLSPQWFLYLCVLEKAVVLLWMSFSSCVCLPLLLDCLWCIFFCTVSLRPLDRYDYPCPPLPQVDDDFLEV